VRSGFSAALAALAVSAGCAGHASDAGRQSANRPPASAVPPVAPFTQATAVPQTKKWIDLTVGDCLADPPPTDPSVLTVTVVDCATAHHAEVYARTPVAVNAAVATVADQQCATRFDQYTGRSLSAGPYVITYLIDSDQDRTSADTTPSTVICLLAGAGGQPLTGSARR
jgi:hypothetical protein